MYFLALGLLFVLKQNYVLGELKCGGRKLESLSSSTWTCCGGKPYHKSQNVFACCQGNCYNAASQFCCGGDIFTRVNANSACCNGKFYQRGLHLCCGTEIVDITTHDCCRNVPFSTTESVCCNGTILKKDGSGGKSSCCGETLYNPITEMCCADKVVENKYGYFTKCCGANPYDSQTKSCCQHKIIIRQPRKDVCCDYLMINRKNNICCGGHAKPRIFGKFTGCCRVGEPIDPYAEYAENILEFYKYSDRHRRAHLGQFVTYDLRKDVCCAGKLSKKLNGGETACCNREAYNVKTHVCCGNKISARITGIQERCCDGKPYDRRNSICCSGTLNPFQGYHQHIFCCGKVAYDRRRMECNHASLESLGCERPVFGDKQASK